MQSLLSLVWRYLVAHSGRSLLTILAIALGVAVSLAAIVIGQVATQHTHQLPTGPQVDLELEVVSRDASPFHQTSLALVIGVPGVGQASPSLRVDAKVAHPPIPHLSLVGVSPEEYLGLHEPELADGAFLDRPGTIVLPMWMALQYNLQRGDEITLRRGHLQVNATVAGRLQTAQSFSAFAEAASAYVPLELAQELAGAPDQIDRIEVRLQQGADTERVRAALSAELGKELVVVHAAVGGGIATSVYLVQIAVAMIGAIILFAAAFVVLNAFAMAVTGRMRELGILRTLGMTRRQIIRQVLLEGSILGLVGGALGLPGGLGLAWGVLQVFSTQREQPFRAPWWGILLSLLVGLGITLLGALQPAWRASRTPPLTAVRSLLVQEDTSWYVRRGGRWGGALLIGLLLAATAIALLHRPSFFEAFLFLGITQAGLLLSTVLLLPALVPPVVSLCRPFLTHWMGTAGRLAADNLERNQLRTVLTVGALTAVLTVFVATGGLITASLKGGLRGYFDLFHEDALLLPDVLLLLTSGELTMENTMERLTTRALLDPALVEALEDLVDEGLLRLEYIGFAPVPEHLSPMPGAPAVFVEPEIFLPLGNFDFFEGNQEDALEAMQRGRAVLLVPITAERLGVGVGDPIAVMTPHGEITFTVAGIGGNGYNFSVFSYSDGAAYFDMSGPSWLGMIILEGYNADQVMARVQKTIEPFAGVTAGILDPAALETSWFRIVDQLQMLLDGLLFLAMLVAALGVVNTMVINVAERRREIGLLRAVGATRRQLRRAVLAEAAILGLLATLVATVLSVLMLALFVLMLTPGGTASVGIRVTRQTAALALLPALRDLGIAALIALVLGPLTSALAAFFPACRAAASNVVESTRSEQVTI